MQFAAKGHYLPSRTRITHCKSFQREGKGAMFRKNEFKAEEDQNIMLDYSSDYKNLISLLLGSLYVNYHSQTFSNADVTMKRLTKDASQLDAAEFPNQSVEFQELKSMPLGHLKRKGSNSKH